MLILGFDLHKQFLEMILFIDENLVHSIILYFEQHLSIKREVDELYKRIRNIEANIVQSTLNIY